MKISKIIYMASAALALTSCSDFLDTPTDTRVELVTTEQLQMLMNSAYPSANYAWPCELMSDNIEDNNSPDGEGNQGIHYNLPSYDRGDEEMFRWEQCVSSTGSDSPSEVWEGMYGSIATANAVLDRLDEMQKAQGGHLDRTQVALQAEAQMLRAYDHFILAQVFCQPYRGSQSVNYVGIPYITKPEVTVKPHYERGTLDQTYKKIQNDLEAALPNIDNTIYGVQKYHFNQSAAYAFAARFYLFTRQYEKALNAANKAFGGEGADCSSYMSDIWQNLSNFYDLADFGLYQKSTNRTGNFLLYPTYSTLMRRLSGGRRYGLVRSALDATLHGAGPTWERFRWRSSNNKGGSFTMHPCYQGACYINGQSEYGLFCGTNVDEQFEYTDKIAGIGYCHITRREFFGEETLLVRAEAKLFMGDIDGAVADLKVWELSRRNCPGAVGYEDEFTDLTLASINNFYGTDRGFGINRPINIDRVCPESDARVSAESVMPVLQCIQHFRRIETVHTGMRWFDIKRYGIEFDRKIGNNVAPQYHTMDRLTLDDPRRAVQIPSEVVAAGMQPNPRGEAQRQESSELILLL